MRAAASSSSPATASLGHWSPSKSDCGSASRPASSPTSGRRISPRVWRSSASGRCSTRSPSRQRRPGAIAERVTDNVRALEGALIRVVAYHSLTTQPIDLELTLTVLDAMYPEPRRGRSAIGHIQTTVAVSVRSRGRRAHLARVARRASPGRASWRSIWPREITSTSLQAIGDAFGGRNHATVLHACKRVSERVTKDQQLGEELGELKAAVRPERPTEAIDRLRPLHCGRRLPRYLRSITYFSTVLFALSLLNPS